MTLAELSTLLMEQVFLDKSLNIRIFGKSIMHALFSSTIEEATRRLRSSKIASDPKMRTLLTGLAELLLAPTIAEHLGVRSEPVVSLGLKEGPVLGPEMATGAVSCTAEAVVDHVLMNRIPV
jgi:hypothetical protein